MAAAPPIAEAKELMTVTPICTVAKNRSGSFFKRATAEADFTAFSSRASIRLLRVAIIAISDAAKKPFARIKTRIRTASNHIFSRIIVGSPNVNDSILIFSDKKPAAMGFCPEGRPRQFLEALTPTVRTRHHRHVPSPRPLSFVPFDDAIKDILYQFPPVMKPRKTAVMFCGLNKELRYRKGKSW